MSIVRSFYFLNTLRVPTRRKLRNNAREKYIQFSRRPVVVFCTRSTGLLYTFSRCTFLTRTTRASYQTKRMQGCHSRVAKNACDLWGTGFTVYIRVHQRRVNSIRQNVRKMTSCRSSTNSAWGRCHQVVGYLDHYEESILELRGRQGYPVTPRILCSFVLGNRVILCNPTDYLFRCN